MSASRRDFLRGRASTDRTTGEADPSGLSKRQFLELFAMLLFVLFGLTSGELMNAIKAEPRDGRAMSSDEFRRKLKEHYLPLWDEHIHTRIDIGRFLVRK